MSSPDQFDNLTGFEIAVTGIARRTAELGAAAPTIGFAALCVGRGRGITQHQGAAKAIGLVLPELAAAAIRCERNAIADIVAMDQSVLFNSLGALDARGTG